MREETYKIIFTGQAIDDFTLADVEAGFTAAFKFNEQQIAQIFCGEAVILKQNVEHQAALQLQQTLTRLGAQVYLQASSPATADALTLVPKTETSDDSQITRQDSLAKSPAGETANRSAVEQRMTCPKCAAGQPKAEQCFNCGIVFARFWEIQAHLKTGGNSADILPKHIGLRRAAREPDNRSGWLYLPGLRTAIVLLVMFTCLYFFFTNTRVWQVYEEQNLIRSKIFAICGSDDICQEAAREQMPKCLQQNDLRPFLDAPVPQQDAELKRLLTHLSECFVDEQGTALITLEPDKL